MNQQSALVSQGAAPAAVTRQLSFCKTTARDLAAWLRSLPKANTGEYSRQLYMALNELSRLQAAPELRIQLLEQLRPEVALITKQLETNHLLNSVILNARANKVATLCHTLQNHLTSGYKQAVADLQGKKSGLLALAIQRTLHGLFTSLARAHLTYRNVPRGLWFEAHQMYRLTAHYGLQKQKVKDPLLSAGEELTLEQAYCCSLLLGCAPANQMRQSDIKTLVDALPRWSRLAILQDIEQADSLFAVALTTDTVPRYRALLNLAGRSHILGLNTSRLTDAILTTLSARQPDSEQQPSPLIDPGVSSSLLQLLACAWGNIAKRGFPRTTSTETLQLVLGMSSVHYQLSGNTPFEETLNLPAATTTLELSTDTGGIEQDIWAQAADVLPDGTSFNGEIHYIPPKKQAELAREEEEQAREKLRQHNAALYPVLEARIVNRSPGGYCLEWPVQAPANLQTGDILAVRKDASHDWSVATIRWIRQNDQTGAQIGVEIMAHRAAPCAARLLRSGKAASDYLRALQVPAISGIARPAQIITARIPFREGCTVTLNTLGEETRIILGRQVEQTASCSLFEYVTVKAATKNQSPATASPAPGAGDHAKVNDPEDFTSLWDHL